MTIDALPECAEAARLDDVLRRAGVLADGRVASVAVDSARDTVLSRIIRLRPSYEGNAADAPRTLILKTGHPDRKDPTWNAGRQEVAFYSRVAAAMPGQPVPCCFDARWDETTNDWHLLLEDLAETHMIATVWPLPPSIAQCEFIMDAWARFHAAWWDDPRLGDSVGEWSSSSDIDGHLRRFAHSYARFAEQLGDRLPQERRDLYQRFIGAAPKLLERNHARRHMTITHGDAHVWNCFFPRDGRAETVRLFDWDSWRIGVATSDLAYMMAMHWHPDRRHRLERALLDRYHAALVARGVRGYSRHDLDDDYRWATLVLIMRPVTQQANSIPPLIWWNNLERIFLAVDDLACGDLLRASA